LEFELFNSQNAFSQALNNKKDTQQKNKHIQPLPQQTHSIQETKDTNINTMKSI
jgi:hypothetical protein